MSPRSSKTQFIENIIDLVNVALQSEYQAQTVTAIAHELDQQLDSLDDGFEDGLTVAEIEQLNIYLVAATKNLTEAAVIASLAAESKPKQQTATVRPGGVDITAPARDYSQIRE